MHRIWQWAWGLRIYISAALAVALVLAMVASLVGYGQRQNRQDARRDTDEAALRAAIVRITIDEGTISDLVEQNRASINNNSAAVGTNKLDISDLRALVAQTKSEVIRQLDGLDGIGLPTPTDTVAAKLLAILQRLDRLEARLDALDAASHPSPAARPSPSPTGPEPRGQRPAPSPGAPREPSTGERCVIPPAFVCSGASGSSH